jgi:hypothetical protein
LESVSVNCVVMVPSLAMLALLIFTTTPVVKELKEVAAAAAGL